MKALRIDKRRIGMQVNIVPVNSPTLKLNVDWTIVEEECESEPMDDDIAEDYMARLIAEIEKAVDSEREEPHILRLEKKLKKIMTETLRG